MLCGFRDVSKMLLFKLMNKRGNISILGLLVTAMGVCIILSAVMSLFRLNNRLIQTTMSNAEKLRLLALVQSQVSCCQTLGYTKPSPSQIVALRNKQGDVVGGGSTGNLTYAGLPASFDYVFAKMDSTNTNLQLFALNEREVAGYLSGKIKSPKMEAQIGQMCRGCLGGNETTHGCCTDEQPSDPCDPTKTDGLMTFEDSSHGASREGDAIAKDFYLRSHLLRIEAMNGTGGTTSPPLIGRFESAQVPGWTCEATSDSGCNGEQNKLSDKNIAYKSGRYFLSPQISGQYKTLRITLLNPTAKISGTLIDVDKSESYRLIVQNSKGQELTRKTIRANDPGTGNGVGTQFSFELPTADISRLFIVPNRNTSDYALDNFSGEAVCRQ